MSDAPESNGRFRRFLTFQVILHWIVALPYMFLLGTGALLMLHRLGLAAWAPEHVLATAHRWTGIATAVLILEALLAALVGGHWRSVGRDLLHWLSLLPRDLLWLAKAPLNTFFPRTFPLPLTGRFNAGQKLHGLFIVTAVTGFIITGAMMILRPAWLRPWIIHTWLFFGAVGFLGLHLFLGLINPVTRRALSGVFTGHVPIDYVRAHHALEIAEASHSNTDHPAAVSWKAMLLVGVLIASGVAAWWYRSGRESFRTSPTASREHGAIMPGMLIAAHADAAKAQRCDACHVDLAQPTNAACLACHTEIDHVMREKIGYHGQIAGQCAACHQDHHGRDADLRGLDSQAFNHQLARFPLRGAHQSLNCGQCHVQHSAKPGHAQFVGLETSVGCTQCHADPHGGQFTQTCTACHSDSGWKGRNLLFDHNRDAGFKIDAIHRAVACASCHGMQNGHRVFTTVPTACEQCHSNVAGVLAGPDLPDPHFSRTSCASCHPSDIQAPTAAQFADACEKCHTPLYRNLFFDWERSLDDREAAALRAISKAKAAHPVETETDSRRVVELRKAGIHNVQATLKGLDAILGRYGATQPTTDPATPAEGR